MGLRWQMSSMKIAPFPLVLVCGLGMLSALLAGLCLSWWVALWIVTLPLAVFAVFVVSLRFALGLAAKPVEDGYSW